MNKQERIKIYQETVSIVNEGEYILPNGDVIDISANLDKMVEGTRFYTQKVETDSDNKDRYDTRIKVINNDSLYEAWELLDMGLKPCVLNMASFHTPGGGVINGSSAQEENIFRRTNIFKSLYQFHPLGKNYGVKQKIAQYPLNFNYGGIYTPNVTVFRKSEDKGYNLMEEPFIVDVVTVPAVRKPQLIDGKIEPRALKAIKNKIHQILAIALENGNDSLILSAFGCGAYGTPPDEMAKLFADALTQEEFVDRFKVIHFAIIDLPSTNGEHNPNGNLKPFKDIFGYNKFITNNGN